MNNLELNLISQVQYCIQNMVVKTCVLCAVTSLNMTEFGIAVHLVSCHVTAGEDSSNDVRGTDVRSSTDRRQRGSDFPSKD